MNGEDILFIVNPISGNISRKRKVIALIKERGWKLSFTEYRGHAEVLARNAGERIVVAVGGDGTVNEVARGIALSGKTLGIIPCGSGDGLARHLGIKGSPSKMLETVLNGDIVGLDCCQVNGKPFFSVCGTGLDAIVSERFAKNGKRGLFTYVKEAVKTWKDFSGDTYTVSIDGKAPFEVHGAMVTAGNSNQWGNGAKIAPNAKADDGLLELTVVKMFRTSDIPQLVRRLMDGTIDKSEKVECYSGRELIVRHEKYCPSHCDGDFFEGGKELRIRVTGEKLNVLVPKKAALRTPDKETRQSAEQY